MGKSFMEIYRATIQGTCPGSQGSSTYNPGDTGSTLPHSLPAVNSVIRRDTHYRDVTFLCRQRISSVLAWRMNRRKWSLSPRVSTIITRVDSVDGRLEEP